MKNSFGFTLIELMIVIAIISILGAISIPQYVKYSKRAKYTEVVAATVKFKKSAEVAFQVGIALSDLNSGTNGIPAAVTPTTSTNIHLKSLSVSQGIISATGTALVNGAVYQLDATPAAGGLNWSLNNTASTCLGIGYCSPL